MFSYTIAFDRYSQFVVTLIPYGPERNAPYYFYVFHLTRTVFYLYDYFCQ